MSAKRCGTVRKYGRAASDHSPSKPLDPWPQFDLPRPRASRLHEHRHVAARDRIGIERPVIGVALAPPANGAVDHEVRDVNAFWRQLARHALREPAKRELAHREGC